MQSRRPPSRISNTPGVVIGQSCKCKRRRPVGFFNSSLPSPSRRVLYPPPPLAFLLRMRLCVSYSETARVYRHSNSLCSRPRKFTVGMHGREVAKSSSAPPPSLLFLFFFPDEWGCSVACIHGDALAGARVCAHTYPPRVRARGRGRGRRARACACALPKVSGTRGPSRWRRINRCALHLAPLVPHFGCLPPSPLTPPPHRPVRHPSTTDSTFARVCHAVRYARSSTPGASPFLRDSLFRLRCSRNTGSLLHGGFSLSAPIDSAKFEPSSLRLARKREPRSSGCNALFYGEW